MNEILLPILAKLEFIHEATDKVYRTQKAEAYYQSWYRSIIMSELWYAINKGYQQAMVEARIKAYSDYISVRLKKGEKWLDMKKAEEAYRARVKEFNGKDFDKDAEDRIERMTTGAYMNFRRRPESYIRAWRDSYCDSEKYELKSCSEKYHDRQNLNHYWGKLKLRPNPSHVSIVTDAETDTEITYYDDVGFYDVDSVFRRYYKENINHTNYE
jgi:hypothetical protein